MSKVLSIIYLVASSLSLICIIAFTNDNPLAASGWAIIGSVIALCFSIVGLIQNNKNKSPKSFSIVAVVWSALSVVCVFALSDDLQASAGWGILCLILAIPYAIYSIVKAPQSGVVSNENLSQIDKLHELLQKGAITPEEFAKKKNELL